MKKVLSVFLLIICCFSIMACSEESDPVQNIKGSSVWAYHDTTITLTSCNPIMGGEPAKFKEDINTSDIILDKILEGKTVKSVKYISETEVEVVLAGKIKNATTEDYAIITVSKRALFSDYDSFATVSLKKSCIQVVSIQKSIKDGIYQYNASLKLDNGYFTEYANMENVKLAEGSSGKLQYVDVKNNSLLVKVADVTSEPTILLSASTTSFNKAVSIILKVGTFIEME